MAALRKAIPVAVMALVLSGCASAAEDPDPEQDYKLERAESRIADLEAKVEKLEKVNAALGRYFTARVQAAADNPPPQTRTAPEETPLQRMLKESEAREMKGRVERLEAERDAR